MERDVLTVEEAAQRLGIGRGSAYEAARRGEIPVIRIGRRILVPRLAFERMLSQPSNNRSPGSGADPNKT